MQVVVGKGKGKGKSVGSQSRHELGKRDEVGEEWKQGSTAWKNKVKTTTAVQAICAVDWVSCRFVLNGTRL